jgi:hypothetical protein
MTIRRTLSVTAGPCLSLRRAFEPDSRRFWYLDGRQDRHVVITSIMAKNLTEKEQFACHVRTSSH